MGCRHFWSQLVNDGVHRSRKKTGASQIAVILQGSQLRALREAFDVSIDFSMFKDCREALD
jgi:hypothetical protein